MNKKKVGIIGAGAAGMTCAWLLDKQYEIVLFEREAQLGGHVCTIPITLVNGKTISVETGAEFFSDSMFGQFNKLLHALDISVRKYPLSYTFYNTVTGHTISLPPIHDNAIKWHSFQGDNLFNLLEFKEFIDNALSIVAQQQTDVTIYDYCQSIPLLSSSFLHQFLYPFLGASWGITPEEVKSLSAYNILQWIIKNKPSGLTGFLWNEVEGGLNTYIFKIVQQLKTTQIFYNTPILSVTYDGKRYQLKQANGQLTTVDYLIIATNAHEARQLLEYINHAHELKKSLGNIEYFKTTIAVHGDKRLMPQKTQDWSIANIAFDGKHSALTICKPHMKEANVYRSWITYRIKGQLKEHELPEPLYAIKHFYHPKPTPDYFETQKQISETLGHKNLWIAGFYTTDLDSHNSAILSAITIAKKLNPDNSRLHYLTS